MGPQARQLRAISQARPRDKRRAADNSADSRLPRSSPPPSLPRADQSNAPHPARAACTQGPERPQQGGSNFASDDRAAFLPAVSPVSLINGRSDPSSRRWAGGAGRTSAFRVLVGAAVSEMAVCGGAGGGAQRVGDDEVAEGCGKGSVRARRGEGRRARRKRRVAKTIFHAQARAPTPQLPPAMRRAPLSLSFYPSSSSPGVPWRPHRSRRAHRAREAPGWAGGAGSAEIARASTRAQSPSNALQTPPQGTLGVVLLYRS